MLYTGIISIIVILIFLIILIKNAVYVVRENHVYIIERLGKYHTTVYPGLHIKIPFVDEIVGEILQNKKCKRLRSIRFTAEDNKTIEIDTDICYEIIDNKTYWYSVLPTCSVYSDPNSADKECREIIRKVIKEVTFDEYLNDRDSVNNKLREGLHEVAWSWGVNLYLVDTTYKIIEDNKKKK